MQRREVPPPRELSHTRTATLIVALCTGVVAILIALALLGFEMQSAVRAYVNGESLWTKAQKEATLHLLRYARDGDPAEFDRFRAALEVNYGDRVAREELEKPDPDLAVVRQGFLQGGNHPDDIERMADAFRRLRSVWFVDSAIAIWAEADTWIDSLAGVGTDLAAVRPGLDPRADTTLALITRITAIDRRLTGYEQAFSGILGEGARWTQRLLAMVVIVIGIALVAVVAIIAWTTVRRLRSEEAARRASEAALETQIRRTQKMEAVGQLTGGIAHEFNNLLTIITANAEMLAGHPGLDDSATQRNLGELTRAADRGAGLVRRLLALSRRNALRVGPVNLAVHLEESCSALRRQLPPTIELVVEVEPELPWVRADQDALRQVLSNLVTNAREALASGGRITIAAHRDGADGVAIAIHDDGTGMGAEVRARAFEPFFTTKPIGPGSGLGLAMAEALVGQLGGRIELDSEPGRGTMVTVHLRAASPDEAATTPLADDPPQGRGELILLVEDEDALRLAARRVLTAAGYRVREASNGREGLDRLREDPVAIDLVLSDLVMPEMGGRELLHEARREGFAHRFLFMSGYAPGTGQPDAEDVTLLPKPWTMAELLHAVGRELADREAAPGA